MNPRQGTVDQTSAPLAREFATRPLSDEYWAGEVDDISRSYRDLPVLDQSVVWLWEELGAHCRATAAMLRESFDITVYDDLDPYTTSEQMLADIDRGVYKVTSLHSHHPVWDPETNVAFRITHDITGHALTGSDFSFKGEVTAYRNQCMSTPEHLWPVLFTEVVAQSAYCNVHHLFGEQKVALVPLTQAEIDEHVGQIMDAPDAAYDATHRSASQQQWDRVADALNARQGANLTLYRGEGSHDRPSYYPKTGPSSTDAGGWWTTDLASAQQYAKSSDGQVYVIDVDDSEAERRGLPQYRFIPDPEVRERRRLYTGSVQAAVGSAPRLRLAFDTPDGLGGRIIAWDEDRPLSEQPHGVGILTWNKQGKVAWVQVYEDADQRRGIGTAMWDEAKKHEPRLHHSDEQSESGRAWAQTTAAVQTKPVLHLLSEDDEEAVRQLREHHGLSSTAAIPTSDEVFGHEGLQRVIADKGFTVNSHFGDNPTSGYMVSTVKNSEEVYPLASITAADIAAYRRKHAAQLANPNSYMGAWVWEGNVYLDVSTHVPEESQALALARQHDQLGIYDLATGDTIETSTITAASRTRRLAMRTCDRCGGRVAPFMPRKRMDNGDLVCRGCENLDQNSKALEDFRVSALDVGASEPIRVWAGSEWGEALGRAREEAQDPGTRRVTVEAKISDGTYETIWTEGMGMQTAARAEVPGTLHMSTDRCVTADQTDLEIGQNVWVEQNGTGYPVIWEVVPGVVEQIGDTADDPDDDNPDLILVRHPDGSATWSSRWHVIVSIPGVTAARKVAHDSGDGVTIYHCPFCGAGSVIARSDGTAECQFCQKCFTVQVQPTLSATPQTINGVPHVHPDMPGSSPDTPPAQPAQQAPADHPASPVQQGDHDAKPVPEDPTKPKKHLPPWLQDKKSSALYLTADGVLPEEAYQRHLALRFADDREQVLATLKSRDGK